ncbi:MAG: M48 family metalloprotease [Desulfobacteraceae bacterium]|nr:M48 family metalloprotease [Desulfobacteraceae bacterium]
MRRALQILCWLFAAMFFFQETWALELEDNDYKLIDQSEGIAAGSISGDDHNFWQKAGQKQAELEHQWDFFESKDVNEIFDHVVCRLWKQVHSDLPPPAVKIIKDPLPNAFVYPNGACFVTTGLLTCIFNEDQLAMILAHEMVHYVQKHALGVNGHFTTPHISNEGFGAGKDSGKGKGLSEARIDTYRLEAEYKADIQGLNMMLSAGYCISEAISLLDYFIRLGSGAGFEQMMAVSLISYEKRKENLINMLEKQSESKTCNDMSQSGELFRKAIAPVLLSNARSALRRGLYPLADKNGLEYLSLRPLDPNGHFVLGEVRRLSASQGSINDALIFYKNAIDLNRQFAPAYKALGIVYMKSGQKKLAKTYFETYLSLEPHDNDCEFIKGYISLCGN